MTRMAFIEKVRLFDRHDVIKFLTKLLAHEKLTGTQPRSSTEPSPRKAGRKCKQLPKSQRAQPKLRMSLEQDRDLMLGSRHGTPLGYKPFNPSIRHHSQSRDGQPGPESIHSPEDDYDAMDSPIGTVVGGKAQPHLYEPQKHGAVYDNGGYMWDEHPNGELFLIRHVSGFPANF